MWELYDSSIEELVSTQALPLCIAIEVLKELRPKWERARGGRREREEKQQEKFRELKFGKFKLCYLCFHRPFIMFVQIKIGKPWLKMEEHTFEFVSWCSCVWWEK